MVKKLLKHEFLAYLRVWIPMQIILMAITLFGRILRFFESDNDIYSIINVTSIVLYVLAIIVSLGLTLVFGIVRFYKNLFSKEGYLSFTLPVTISQHLSAKVITAGIFMLFTYVSVLISVLIMTSGELFSKIVKTINSLIENVYAYTGTNLTFYIIEVLALLFITSFTQFLLYYACISIGQRFRGNRALGAVVVYFIYYIITQILGTLLVVVVALIEEFSPVNGILQFAENHPLEMIHVYLCGMLVIELLMAILYYFVTHTMIRKKLNLE